MTAPRVTVVVAEDHPIFREGLVRALRERPELEVVADVGDGREALEALREHTPAVAVLDLHLPGLDALAILNALERDGLGTRVLVVTGEKAPETVFAAVSRGAAGYLPKESTREELCDAVVAVARGGTVLPAELHAGLAEQIRRHRDGERPVLSAREQEILALTAGGSSAPEIAAQLHLSPATVRTHLQNLYEKLGVSDRAAAVAEGMRRGLLE